MTPIYWCRRKIMNSLTGRLGLWLFVLYGLTCLVGLLHKSFVYW
jgi:hypothetical protein